MTRFSPAELSKHYAKANGLNDKNVPAETKEIQEDEVLPVWINDIVPPTSDPSPDDGLSTGEIYEYVPHVFPLPHQRDIAEADFTVTDILPQGEDDEND